jgi:DHA2 family multidrug resistance protein
MAAFLLSMQYVIEEGSGEGWFQDDVILWLTVLATITGVSFVWRELAYRQPIVSLKPFKDRNFAVGAVMNFVAGVSLYGGTFILPLFLGRILGYSAGQVGTTMIISGLTMFLTAPIAGRFVRKMDPRIPLIFGFGVAAFGIGLGARVTENWGFWECAVLQMVRGVGVMTAMIASQQMSVSTMPIHLMKDASGLVNLIRNVGGAVGLALLTTVLTNSTATHLSELSAAVTLSSPESQAMLEGMTAMMEQGGALNPEGAGYKLFGQMLSHKAATLGFADAFVFLAAGSVIAAILPLLSRPGKGGPPPEALEAH